MKPQLQHGLHKYRFFIFMLINDIESRLNRRLRNVELENMKHFNDSSCRRKVNVDTHFQQNLRRIIFLRDADENIN